MSAAASPPAPKRTAMVLAAGLGVRMRPLTLNTPKPLIEVAGKALIDHAFDRLREAQVRLAVVNVHYLAEQIEDWAMRQPPPPIVISDERPELLDTGGGIVKALPQLGAEPFFVVNSDSFWIDGTTPALARLEEAWDAQTMDSLLLLCPRASAIGYEGEGDFDADAGGRLTRRPKDGSAPHVYAGCYLVSPRLFHGAPEGKFSMNLLWDRAAAAGRLRGLVHDGRWVHVGSPAAIAHAEHALRTICR
ncbi:MAG: nucleotidyltransferase family protein [Pseudomonadota bacterium]|nr:nucleotidyltransferase family protein [Pseudomonadota bacterium]